MLRGLKKNRKTPNESDLKLKDFHHLAIMSVWWLKSIEVLLDSWTKSIERTFAYECLRDKLSRMVHFSLSVIGRFARVLGKRGSFVFLQHFLRGTLTVNGTWILPAGLARQMFCLWVGRLAGGHGPKTCALLLVRRQELRFALVYPS